MRKLSLSAVLGFMLVLFFQNCGQVPPNSSGTQSLSTGTTAAASYNKYSASTYPTLSIWDYLHSQFLDVNLQTGVMVSFEEAGQVRGTTYCLPPEKLNELNHILGSAEICEPVVKASELEGQVCTMAYRYPYASLVDKTGEVHLGEKNNGCDIPIDLCGDKAAALKQVTVAVVTNLSKMNCP